LGGAEGAVKGAEGNLEVYGVVGGGRLDGVVIVEDSVLSNGTVRSEVLIAVAIYAVRRFRRAIRSIAP